jgi:hypothetical protein
MPSNHDLLKPELAEAGPNRSLYSPTALFLTAFWGGPLAVMALSALNSKRMVRLKKDAPCYIVFPAVLFTFYYFAITVPDGVHGLSWLDEYRRSHPFYKHGPKALALIFWAVSHALHKKQHKAMQLLNIKPKSPWLAAVAASLLGGFASFCMVLAVLYINGLPCE